MKPMTVGEIAAAARGEILLTGADASRRIGQVSIDTRTLQRGSLFMALKGPHFDGHDFVSDAVRKGAAGLLVSAASPVILESARNAGVAVILVRNTMSGLAALAKAQRASSPATVIAITGSTGKTITKDFTASVLRRAGKVNCSKDSYNNEIGLPLTLLNGSGDARFSVLEMGSRGAGHISKLCEIAGPRVGVITNIGWSHMQYFRNRDNLAKAKAELLQSLPAGGTAVINADDDYAGYLRSQSPVPVVTFGTARGAQVRAQNIRLEKSGKVIFTLKSKGGSKATIRIPLPGRHNVGNVLAAAAAGEIMGVDMESIVEGIEGAELTGWRMEMITKPEEITIINDAYNANPVSMRSALMALGDISMSKRAIAVLGDMRELGPVSEEAHFEVGKMAVDYGTDILITVGRKARKIAEAAREEGLPRGSIFTTYKVDKAAEILRAIIEPGDVVLIKGSRFLGLERLVDLVA
jgi:UDP-N-acetylmuramoyl-tripeptide--D-alanyl-D-alanine ligase